MAQVGALPAPKRTLQWLRANRDLNGRYLLEFSARSIGNAGTIIAAGAIAGLPAAAALRGAQVIMTPVTLTNMGLTIFGIPQAVRTLKTSVRRMTTFCACVTAILVGAAITWGGIASVMPASSVTHCSAPSGQGPAKSSCPTHLHGPESVR